MRDAKLDNPIWQALTGPHQRLAQGPGPLLWYPQDVAPFFAVPSPDTPLDPDLPQQLGLREAAYFVGVLPDDWPRGWRVHSRSEVLQMTYAGGTPLWEPSPHVLLGPADRDAMNGLAGLAFPDFFRARSAELGTFIGISERGRLISMAGERMALPGMQEISGICTHPQFTGRGYAGGLTRALIRRHRELGLHSFLHVSAANVAARRLYELVGFSVVATLPIVRIESAPSA
jgi:ribosomal protein S18 acetylase RimI-like enzyme